MPEDFGVTQQAIREFNQIQSFNPWHDDPLDMALFSFTLYVVGGVFLYGHVVTWESFSGAPLLGFFIV